MKPQKVKTTKPLEWNGKSFNVWQRYIQRELDKIHKTDVASKYKVN